jgi:hypothetical protein
MSSPARLDINIVAGDDETVQFVVTTDGTTPVDLTGRNYLMQVRADPAGTNTAECTFTCTVPTPANGTVVCVAADTETDNLTPGQTYWWSLLELAGSVESTLVGGRVTVQYQVTKD